MASSLSQTETERSTIRYDSAQLFHPHQSRQTYEKHEETQFSSCFFN